VLLSTFMTDHFDLFGLRQVWFRFVDRVYAHPPFAVVGFYRFVRHPLYSGLFLAFWATPDMSLGHLVFALGMTVYVLLAVPLEERDLASHLGRAYGSYAQRVPKFIPSPGRVHKSVRSEESAPSGMR
ncbi:MAG: isoprenylcysteine carboxylmethyltransferase family protein, partial [Xanthomonadales bacterium]|nr:isoprenylcysteine carboxylmethyltransferase family protein [Xanthomonadales bacterium]NNK39005.1 isoprenylcysteine carboxylmethyltransferase family protein [Xanthomonadales bacterium]